MPTRPMPHRAETPRPRSARIGFVFPGQGSQSVGMLRELAAAHPQVQATFEEASSVLGLDLWRLAQDGPEAELNRTERTQPAMLAAGVAAWRAWRGCGGPEPMAMAGHSLGEYTALVCAGALAFTEAVRLVAERGRLMQEAVPEGEGAMAAILGLDDDAVAALCAEAAGGEVLEPVNFNAPGQVVVAGHAGAVARAVELAPVRGAKRAVRLAVSVPSHCRLMRPAAERLAAYLRGVDFARPRVPVWHNVHAAPEANPAAIRRALAAQLHSPVRWTETVARLTAAGVEKLIECGPGRVLAGLNRRIDRRVPTLSLADPEALEQALAAVGASGVTHP